MALPALSSTSPAALEADLAYATELARADLLPDAYKGKPANLLLALEYGRMLDVSPLVAIQHVHVINGRLGLSAEMMRAKVRAAGHRLRVTERSTTEATVELTTVDDPEFTTAVTYSIDEARVAGALDVWWERWSKTKDGRNRKETWLPPPGPLPATVEDLHAAGAPDWVIEAGPGGAKRNENWWRHPAAMLVARATSAAVRAACPEVLMGLEVATDLDGPPIATYTDEPVDDVDDGDDTVEIVLDDEPATPDQLERIHALARRLDDHQAAAAGAWRAQHDLDWSTLTTAQGDQVLAYLDQLVTGAAGTG